VIYAHDESLNYFFNTSFSTEKSIEDQLQQINSKENVPIYIFKVLID